MNMKLLEETAVSLLSAMERTHTSPEEINNHNIFDVVRTIDFREEVKMDARCLRPTCRNEPTTLHHVYGSRPDGKVNDLMGFLNNYKDSEGSSHLEQRIQEIKGSNYLEAFCSLIYHISGRAMFDSLMHYFGTVPNGPLWDKVKLKRGIYLCVDCHWGNNGDGGKPFHTQFMRKYKRLMLRKSRMIGKKQLLNTLQNLHNYDNWLLGYATTS